MGRCPNNVKTKSPAVSSNPFTLSAWISGSEIAVCLVVAVALIVAAWASRKTTYDHYAAPEMRTLLRCGEICDLEISAQDRAFAEATRKHTGDTLASEHTEDLIKVCMFRCQEGDKDASESNGVPPAEKYTTMPDRFQQFVKDAKSCASSGFRRMDRLSQGLYQCGVVHVEGAFPLDLIKDIRSEFLRIYENPDEDPRRTDGANLRGGRQETWLPFQPPFNDSRLLQPKFLRDAVAQYLGPSAVLDHVSVIIASGTAAKTPQKLHADVGYVRNHVEVHVPLVDISADMGPTLFCPASHGLSQRGKIGITSGVERALEWWYLTPGTRCGTDSSLSYARPLKMGQATIYDANVFHGGTANRAGIDRPVLQLSFSRSPEDIAERDYLKNTFKDNEEARNAVLRDVEAFRAAEGM